MQKFDGGSTLIAALNYFHQQKLMFCWEHKKYAYLNQILEKCLEIYRECFELHYFKFTSGNALKFSKII